ncbi:hypothetical protein [Stappia indica]|uniref:hypothetical protein n=1 Tax=Stappia indica TaxID=538381 RepID=UPI0011426074|nr:hypothetical protein [Stappia indica]
MANLAKVGVATLESSGNLRSFGDSLDERKERTARLQLALPERSFTRLEAIKEATEAASFAEVVRRALRVYEGLIAETADGSEVLVRRTDGTEEVIPIGRGL